MLMLGYKGLKTTTESKWFPTWINGLSLKFEDTTTTLKWVSEPEKFPKTPFTLTPSQLSWYDYVT